jgi:hypothetical protein
MTNALAEHTPGPWRMETHDVREYSGGSHVGYHVSAADVRAVASMIKLEADARLIAAAPELLAASKALIDVLDQQGIRSVALEMRVPLYERAADLIDAIAKAEGRQP